MTTYAGRHITVVGLGREGLAVTRVLAREGARITVSDTRDEAALAARLAALDGLDVRLSLGGNRPAEALDCDLLVLSPGVDKRSPLVREALRRGIPISSETELFFERCPARIAGITGSAGKTTTTTLAGEMLRRGLPDRAVFVGGNIGTPLLERVHEMTARDWAVLELSSFQLEWLRTSPHVAAVTNITPNHLDRHDTMEAYIAAKANIVAHQEPGAVAVLNGDEPNAAALAEQAGGCVLYFSLVGAAALAGGDGAYLDGDLLTLIRTGQRTTLCRADEMCVPGRHNIANALAAAAVAASCGVAAEDIGATIRGFRGVPHRQQLIDIINDVAFYDDSIATAPERTLAALAALDGPLVLLLGGRDKHLPWNDLAHAALRRCRGVVLFGEAAPLIRRHLESALDETLPLNSAALLRRDAVVDAPTMAAAVRSAAGLARPGDSVVLAPGCASYDMYRDFEARGDDFVREVGRLVADG